MYQDLRRLSWWLEMKKDITEFVHACFVCQKSKIEHQNLLGLIQQLFLPEWRWDIISMNFVGLLPMNAKGSDYIWVIVDRLK